MKDIGIGIIGWGFMGRTHALCAQNLPLFYPGCPRPRLVSVAARRMESALEAQQAVGFAHATDDWRELIHRADVDAVSICTPNALHEEMAIAALQAGKHIYLDKPMSVDTPSAGRILDAARPDRIAQMAFHNRFFPCVMRAKQWLEEGRLGKPLSFRVQYLHSGSVDADRPAGWKSDANGAGVLLDLGSHALDMLEYLGGRIASIHCRNRTLYPNRPSRTGDMLTTPGEDACFMLAELQSGAVGTVEVSKIATGALDEFRLSLEGDRGAVRFDLSRPDFVETYDNTQAEVPLGGERGWLRIESTAAYPPPGGAFLPSKNAIGWVRAHIACYHHFITSIEGHTPASPSLQEGFRVQRVMEAAMESHRTGRWIDCSEEEER